MLQHAALSPAGGQSLHSPAIHAWSLGSSLGPVHPPGVKGEDTKVSSSGGKCSAGKAIIVEMTNLLPLCFRHSKLVMAQEERPHLLTQ